jgi:hypothetical protein
MDVQPDIRRRLGPLDISIDLPIAGATRCGSTHLHVGLLYRLPAVAAKASASW